jgi:hypothetical protein
VSSNTDFTPLAGPYYARRRNRAEAITEGLVLVLAYAINAACWLVMQPVRFVAYLLGPKA